jgi:4,5-DOPA dioxygenase extradiol
MTRLPVIFFGHGSPMIALEQNSTTARWHAMARTIEEEHGRPKAILCISAHWLTRGTAVTAMPSPPTIHDFGVSFPRALFAKQYPAPGDPELAARVRDLLSPMPVALDQRWGSITAPGRCWFMPFRRPIFRWSSWAWIWPRRRWSTGG